MNTALGTCDHVLALFSAAYFEPARWTGEKWTAAVHIAKARPCFLMPVRLDDTPAPPLLAPLLAAALHGLPRQQAREVLLAALRPAAVRQPSHPFRRRHPRPAHRQARERIDQSVGGCP